MKFDELLQLSRSEVDAQMARIYHPATMHLHAAERHARVLLKYMERVTPDAPREAYELVGWLSGFSERPALLNGAKE